MQLSDFDFDLPEDLIATRPVKPRRAARLLAWEAGRMRDLSMGDLPDVLQPGDRLVINDTRVVPARLQGHRDRETADGSGRARVEVMLIQALPEGRWRALARPLKRLREGDVVVFGAGLSAQIEAREEDAVTLRLVAEGGDVEAALAAAGEVPLPPYIAARRAADAQDRDDYQTVFARAPGSVAAPTASLHFDEVLLAALEARGVAFSRVTLHVGAGTFLPVKVEDIASHRMHAEWGEVSDMAAGEMNATRAAGGRLIAAGTTALRLMESAADTAGLLHPFRGETDIFITPGYRFRAVDGLMTNFHLPKSTLIMLVAALIGLEETRALYAHAVAARYRFFSYGDGSILLPPRA